VLWLVVLTGCGAPTPIRPTPTPFPLPTPAATATVADASTFPATLRALILDERAAAIAGDAVTLADLWAANAVIVDGRATTDPADDYVWRGRDALLDRYRLAVFPAPPPPLTDADLTDVIVEIDGDQATVVNGGDRWRMVQIEGRWRLLELRYN
jgi:hypothetical protein